MSDDAGERRFQGRWSEIGREGRKGWGTETQTKYLRMGGPSWLVDGFAWTNFSVLNFRANWPCEITPNYRVARATSMRELSLYGPELVTLLENILFRVGTRAFQACMQERESRVYRVYTRKLLGKNRSIIRAGNRVCFPERCLGTPHRAPEISRVEICAPVANEPRNTRAPNSADSSIRNEIVFN